jgi:hypothetical protein
MFNRRAANCGFKAKTEPIAPVDDQTVKLDKLPSVFELQLCANNFKAFASLQTF